MTEETIRPPTDEEIARVYDEHPEVVYNHIRRLFLIEHLNPELLLSPLYLVMDKDAARVYYDAPLEFILHYEGEVLLHYQFDVQTRDVIVAERPMFAVHPAWYVTGGVALTVLGFAIGLAVSQ